MNKKGQITLFIIIGLIVAIIAGSAIYFAGQQATGKGKEEAEIIATEVPVEFAQVKDYVESCIRLNAIEALTKLGEHGGYIDMQDERYTPDRAFTFDAVDPTESDGLSLSPAVLSPIAYWWYLQTENDCTNCMISSAAPTTASPTITALTLEDVVGGIERQINAYINLNLQDCINNFEPLKEQSFVFENIGNIEANTIIAENDVVFGVRYPFDVSKGASKAEIENFVVRINLNLREILDLALAVTLYEANAQYLEGILLYLISNYAGIDFEKLPPIAESDENPFTITWSEILVNEKLREILYGNIPLIDAANTKDANQIQGTGYAIFFLDFLDISHDIAANFIYYPNWPVYLKITPSNGDMLEPSVSRTNPPLSVLPPTQRNTYEFFYDVSFPVLVILKDEKDAVKAIFGDQGYEFNFALEGNIRDNIDLLSWNLGEGTIGTTNYGNADFTSGSQTQTIPASLFCTPSQRISAEYTIKAYNAATGIDSLEGVSISYGCAQYRACRIGTTQYDAQESEFLFRGRLPICDGGYLLLQKDGFMDKAVQLTAEFNPVDSNVAEFMEPLVTKQINVKKYAMATPSSFPGSPSDLDPIRDVVTINIDKVTNPNDPFDTPYSQFVILGDTSNYVQPSDGSIEPTQTISLIPGTYEVKIKYLDNNGFTIQPNCKRYCSVYDMVTSIAYPLGHLECTATDTLPKDPIESGVGPLGGAVLNSATGYWRVSKAQLDSSNGIEFRFIQVPTPTCVDEATGTDESCLVPGGCVGLDQLGKVEEHSRNYRTLIEPQWV